MLTNTDTLVLCTGSAQSGPTNESGGKNAKGNEKGKAKENERGGGRRKEGGGAYFSARRLRAITMRWICDVPS